WEALLLEPLVPEHEAGALPVEHLDLVAPAIAEHEQLRSKGRQAELLLDDRREPIDRLPHVDHPAVEVHLDGVAGAHHRGDESRSPRSTPAGGSSSPDHSSTAPPGSDSRNSAEEGRGSRTSTFEKVTGRGVVFVSTFGDRRDTPVVSSPSARSRLRA